MIFSAHQIQRQTAIGILVCAAFLCAGVAQLSKKPSPPPGRLTPAHDMLSARGGHTATVLPDFKVLLAGGKNQRGTVLASTEIYDPTTEKFSAGPRMITARAGHISAILGDSNILIAGGAGRGGAALSSSEVYDYEKERFVTRSNMHSPRIRPTATVLRDGRVLVTGGENGTTPLDSAETYDLLTGKWTLVGTMSAPRFGHTATLLADGRVLIVGGRSVRQTVLSTAEIFDPKTNKFTPGGTLRESRFLHAAALLPGGNVLITGGCTDPAGASASNAAEVYSPATRSSSAVGKMIQPSMKQAEPAVLLDGRVLLIGGSPAAEIYEPRTSSFRTVPGSFENLYYPAVVELMDGSVRIFGGVGPYGISSAGSWTYRP